MPSAIPKRHVLLSSALLCVLVPSIAGCQGSEAWPGSTAPAVAPGTTPGSYGLSDLETIDLYSGKVNFTIPVRDIGGRGAAGYRITLPLQRGWTVSAQTDPGPPSSTIYIVETQQDPDWIYGSLVDVAERPYTPGLMVMRSFNDNQTMTGCPCCIQIPVFTLTKMVYIAPDGTETEFIDQLTGGQPLAPGCNAVAQPRGTVFVAVDGSARTFVAGGTVSDFPQMQAQDVLVAGTLFFPDGTRYVFNRGEVTDIYDAKGNHTQVDGI